MIDTLHHVEAPEGVDLTLRVAGPVPRALAYAADLAVRWLMYGVSAIPLSIALREVGFGLWFALFALGEVIYPIAFELLGGGQTLGKRWVGIRVVHEDGTRVRWQASLTRNLLIAVDLLPGTYLFALVSMLASRRFQRLGDHAAGTLVVYAEQRRRAAPVAAPVLAPAPPAIALSQGEQAALLAFGARAAAFSPARREELAALATPLLRAGAPAAAQLEAVAAYLRGAERNGQERAQSVRAGAERAQ
jgi:uncharacterized RDD family membrane protein YckC